MENEDNQEVKEALAEIILAGSKINAHAIFADQYLESNAEAVADSPFKTFVAVMEHILKATNILKETLTTVDDANFMADLVEAVENDEDGSGQTFH